MREWICCGPFKRAGLHGFRPASSSSLPSGRMASHKQQLSHKEKSLNALTSHLTLPLSIRTHCPQKCVLSGILSWEIRSRQFMHGFTGVCRPCQVSAFFLLSSKLDLSGFFSSWL